MVNNQILIHKEVRPFEAILQV